jgi:hypothetical protein
VLGLLLESRRGFSSLSGGGYAGVFKLSSCNRNDTPPNKAFHPARQTHKSYVTFPVKENVGHPSTPLLTRIGQRRTWQRRLLAAKRIHAVRYVHEVDLTIG